MDHPDRSRRDESLRPTSGHGLRRRAQTAAAVRHDHRGRAVGRYRAVVWLANSCKWISGPRSLPQGGSDRRRHLDGDEAISGEQIVLAALIDDSKVAIPLSLVVPHDGVDLVALERRLVPVVPDANRERARRSGGLSSARRIRPRARAQSARRSRGLCGRAAPRFRRVGDAPPLPAAPRR